ncbi:RDD family protein [Nocardiopsis sp. RSe5-2]|uniref:RDD family protein n=1 Tax=Nocardiopsis endophytica TaxID=3018445 RepID=A0ABT4U692_9ACTN|nr:RDD family protein [Nocardiopsis endophytica]MDA2811970.1 RDD family protein [Nocardiopsis endophytica]
MSDGQQYPEPGGQDRPPQGGGPGQGGPPPPGSTPPGGQSPYGGPGGPGGPAGPDVPSGPQQPQPQQWAQEPPGHGAGQPAYGAPGPAQQAYGGYGPPAAAGVPGDVDVVGRRVGQYIIDGILSSIIPLVAMAVLLPLAFMPTEPDGSPSNPGLAAFLTILVIVLWVLIYIGYWVVWPAKAGGQTLGMKMLGLRVVSADGSEATMGQHFLRWLLLIVDGIFYGLVGLIVILASQGNQRVGDMVAKAYVVRA